METKKEVQPQREGLRIRTPFGWGYRKLAAVLAIPVVVVLCIVAFTWVPGYEANFQQKELAREFMAQCQVIFTDTSQLPKAPDEALRSAQKKRDLTNDALRGWSPRVKAWIYDGNWYAEITFATPEKKSYAKKIGVAVNDIGYNTPSEKSQHLDPEATEP